MTPVNRLGQETSPYLHQHADNPVAWWPWGAEALAEARRLDRPILLSIGYSACHWCHVMAHESFESPEIAALINPAFIAIKIDREERPDLDALYQQALALMGESGGWPLTLFLTPEGVPFWGGTYFPPTPRFGRPAFAEALAVITHAWATDRATIRTQSQRMTDALAGLAASPGPAADEPARPARVAHDMLSHLDPIEGGLLGAPKFPQPGLFRFLWRNGDAQARAMVRLTLDHLCLGGIYDHLGGGFMRYATDARWRVPHFEKMLYDNAQLVALLAEVAAASGSALYRDRVARTIGWLDREMSAPTGAFTAAYDADSEGEEGRFYTWTRGEIESLLPPAVAASVARLYDVRPGGTWEGVNILHRNHPDGAEDGPQIEAARAILFAHRARRPAPARDDKVLADWNGLAIAALAEAGLLFDQPDWQQRAASAFAAIVRSMTVDGRLTHVWCADRAGPPGLVEDLAAMAVAAVTLFETTGESAYLDPARVWLDLAERHHRDLDSGGYFQPSDEAGDLLVRPKSWTDSVVPSGNAAMAEALVRLWLASGEEIWGERAAALFTAAGAALADQGTMMTGLLEARRRFDAAMVLTLDGPLDAPETRALLAAALDSGWPAFTLRRIDAPGPARAVLCRAGVCLAPVDDPAALRHLLRRD